MAPTTSGPKYRLFDTIADPENAPVGGVVWLEDPRAEQIVAKLPPGSQERVTIRDIPFCFWCPAESALKPQEQIGDR